MKIMASGSISSWQIDGEPVKAVRDFIFLDSKITADGDCNHEIKKKKKKKTKHLLLGRKAMTNLASILKVQRHYFANKGLYNQSHGFSSSHVWIWELDSKESWVLKNWCLWTVVLEKALESPRIARRSTQSILKFIVRTDAEAEAPILWPPDAK